MSIVLNLNHESWHNNEQVMEWKQNDWLQKSLGFESTLTWTWQNRMLSRTLLGQWNWSPDFHWGYMSLAWVWMWRGEGDIKPVKVYLIDHCRKYLAWKYEINLHCWLLREKKLKYINNIINIMSSRHSHLHRQSYSCATSSLIATKSKNRF